MTTETVTIELTEREGDFLLSALAKIGTPDYVDDGFTYALDQKVDRALITAFQPTDVTATEPEPDYPEYFCWVCDATKETADAGCHCDGMDEVYDTHHDSAYWA